MSEEKDKFSARLLDFEMNGMTKRQKDVLSKQLVILIDKAARARDALEVVEIQRMQERLNAIELNRPVNVFDYLRDVFIEGQIAVFTFFDLVGIILFFFPSLAQSLIDDVSVIRLVGGIIFFVSFLWANFNLYKKLSEE